MPSYKAHRTTIPLYYRLFFLTIEPISALLGSFYAARPAEYLSLITLSNAPNGFTPNEPIPRAVTISLYQLSNLYLLFALNEALVLRSTDSLRTWKTVLFGLLVADIGHLITMFPLGLEVYWRVLEWNSLVWGSVGFVYLGAVSRILFLTGVGLGTVRDKVKD